MWFQRLDTDMLLNDVLAGQNKQIIKSSSIRICLVDVSGHGRWAQCHRHDSPMSYIRERELVIAKSLAAEHNFIAQAIYHACWIHQ